jgi:diguanylate cyclase (GGDEF)-like protein
MVVKETTGCIALYSSDITTIETVARSLDYNLFCLQVAGKLAALARVIAGTPPDILIVDSPGGKPEMEALARLVENASPPPSVLVITAEDAKDLRQVPPLQALSAGETVSKPVCPGKLAEAINSLMASGKRAGSGAEEPVESLKDKPLVLVVEDSPLQMKVLLRYLEGRDMDIITAADGHEALKLALERVPDLVLLDLVLPGMDGFEVCRRIKSTPATSGVSVIVITTLNDQEDKLNSLRHGADDFITKPVDRRELLLKIGNILKRKKQLAVLASEVSRDPLTGLYNRRYMEYALKREIMDAASSESPLSVIMLDVDHFKHYNDTNGHPAGDMVLKTLGKILATTLRQSDIIARYGGEEFLVILPNTGPEGLVQVMEKIRRAVEEYPFPNGERQPGGRLTVSLGGASFPAHAGEAAELVDLADQALYRAKREGRNCWRLAGENSNHIR